MSESQTSEAWGRLDERHAIAARLLRGEAVRISADEIKAVGGREPRLMTKFDTRASRPSLLSAATILPTANGEYVILPGDGYADMPPAANRVPWRLKPSAAALRSLPWKSGPTSESQALDMAMAAGILDDFLSEQGLRLTVRGRRRSPRFEFSFRCVGHVEHLVADGVQIEVDSGLEGAQIHLLEGKLGTRDNFHIRQLYYPVRMYKVEVPDKEVSAVFMAWSNRTFALRRFAFDPLDDYHALQLTRAVDYTLDDDDQRTPPTVADLLATTSAELEPAGVPFPQADDIRKVVDVVDAVAGGLHTQAEIAARYDFDRRQAAYYANAARYLGLLEAGRGDFALSERGRAYARGGRRERDEMMGRQIVRMRVFRHVVSHWVDFDHAPDAAEVATWVGSTTNLAGTTLARRAITVLSWAHWVMTTFARA